MGGKELPKARKKAKRRKRNEHLAQRTKEYISMYSIELLLSSFFSSFVAKDKNIFMYTFELCQL